MCRFQSQVCDFPLGTCLFTQRSQSRCSAASLRLPACRVATVSDTRWGPRCQRGRKGPRTLPTEGPRPRSGGVAPRAVQRDRDRPPAPSCTRACRPRAPPRAPPPLLARCPRTLPPLVRQLPRLGTRSGRARAHQRSRVAGRRAAAAVRGAGSAVQALPCAFPCSKLPPAFSPPPAPSPVPRPTKVL